MTRAPDDPALAGRIAGLLRAPDTATIADALDALPVDARAGCEAKALSGELARRSGDAASAAALFAEAVASRPDIAELGHALALARLGAGDRAGARDAWRAVLARHGNDAAARYPIALTYDEEGRRDEAIAGYEDQLAHHPAFAAAWNNLGRLHLAAGDAVAAERAYRGAIGARPTAAAYAGLARALERRADVAGALDAWTRAAALAPASATPLERKARLLAGRAELPAAIDLLGRAIAIEPRRATLHWARATHLAQLGEHPAAVEHLRAARALDPGDAQGHSALIVELQHDTTLATRGELAAEHRRWAAEHADRVPRIPARARAPGRSRLRIGYLSPRWTTGPLATLLLPVLERHDRARHEIVLYSAFRHDDPESRRFRALADRWRDLPDDDGAAAAVIADDDIDVLVDCAGHTPGHRLPVLARRPARVQATWMDYVDTTGMAAIDYVLTDAIHVPDDDIGSFVERVVRLPTRLAYRPLAPARATPAPKRDRGHPTFGSFNRHAKLSTATLVAWAAILRAMPEARLLLRAAAYNDAATVEWIRERWRRQDVPVERVGFLPWAAPAAALAGYGEVDVALDPFPYNGGVTTCDALAHGVPLVALSGDRPLARQSAALLAAAGRPEWIASSVDDYVRIACALAAMPHDAADTLRTGLAASTARSPLCDIESFTRAFERACAAMAHAGPREATPGPLPPLEIA
ncbi:MAG: tetratricopeptide repeat protein [Burkholderiales bacterium]|nr:tetratricopeptide repeat protein [Burkholderiales bacterium]